MDEKKLNIQLKKKIKELEYQNQLLREKQEKRLKEGKARLQAITDNIPGVLFQFYARNDGEFGVYYTSSKLFELFGLEFEKNAPRFLQNFIENIHEEDQQSWVESVQEVVQKQIPWKWKGRYVKPSGRVMWFEGHSIPTVHEDEIVFDGYFLDITEKVKQEELMIEAAQKLNHSLLEKEILLREVYHRTKNNMMVIISMLQLGAMDIEDEQSKELFKETENRIRSMSMVHEKLYQSKDLAELELGPYLNEMITALLQNLVVTNRVQLQISWEPIFVCMDNAIPLGLVVNEIITNSIKHAFEDGEGKIHVTLRMRKKEEIELTIRDNGIGFDKNYDIGKSSSFGLQIIDNLIEKQLQGKYKILSDTGTGTEFKIYFSE